MRGTIILELPSELAERARTIAPRTQRRLEDVLLEWLDQAATEIPMHLLPDAEVLAPSDLRMSDDQQAELSELLERQCEGTLDSDGRERLDALLATYWH